MSEIIMSEVNGAATNETHNGTGPETATSKPDRPGNVIRQIRRRLRKEGRTLCSIKDVDGVRRLFVVDLHPAHAVADVEALADRIGLRRCDFCGTRRRGVAPYKDVYICTTQRCMFECIARDLAGRSA